jgi:predicted secreted protein
MSTRFILPLLALCTACQEMPQRTVDAPVQVAPPPHAAQKQKPDADERLRDIQQELRRLQFLTERPDGVAYGE